MLRRKSLARCFPASERFAVFDLPGSLEWILCECDRIAPCVLLVEQLLLRAADPAQFAARVGFGSRIGVLAVGPLAQKGVVPSLLAMGCMGFLPEDVSSTSLRKAVRAVSRGEFWAPRRDLSLLLQHCLLRLSARGLTSRESEVLELIGEGLKNRVIADRLSISRETVRWHIRSLYGKLGVQDREGALLYSRQMRSLADARTTPAPPNGASPPSAHSMVANVLGAA